MTALFDFKISDEAFAYLSIQRGGISDVIPTRARWEHAYAESLRRDYEGILRFLPAEKPTVLDIGSGLGGIDAVLYRHYFGCDFTLVDGLNDPPTVERHDKTFSNSGAAIRFLSANEIPVFGCYSSVDKLTTNPKFDLILSLRAWGFHFAPQPTLSKVLALANPGATIIVDIRQQRFEWAVEFLHALWFGAFGMLVIEESQKHKRVVMSVPE